MDDLGIELSKALFKHEPSLLACDDQATARAAAAVSNLLGCVLAIVNKNRGAQGYESAFKAVCHQIHKSAMSTTENADAVIVPRAIQ